MVMVKTTVMLFIVALFEKSQIYCCQFCLSVHELILLVMLTLLFQILTEDVYIWRNDCLGVLITTMISDHQNTTLVSKIKICLKSLFWLETQTLTFLDGMAQRLLMLYR